MILFGFSKLKETIIKFLKINLVIIITIDKNIVINRAKNNNKITSTEMTVSPIKKQRADLELDPENKEVKAPYLSLAEMALETLDNISLIIALAF